MAYYLLFLACFLSLASFSTSATTKTLQVPSGGPETIDFDWNGDGPYTGVNDGRVVKFAGPNAGFVDFAYTSPQRTKAVCDGTNDPDGVGYSCGRPLGLTFHQASKQLYIADAWHMLCVVGPEGGLATQVAHISDDGIPFKWLDGLDVDQNTGIVYFTDVSTVYNFSQILDHLITGDSTGRLISYNPATKEVKTLMKNLQGAGGVVVSHDSSFVLASEITGNRINKYWLTGPKAKTSELLIQASQPANMRRAGPGEFWVATNVPNEASVPVPTGIRIDGSGNILETVTFGEPFTNININEVYEKDGVLYIGSVMADGVGVHVQKTKNPTSAGHGEL